MEISREELRSLAETRLLDASLLLENGRAAAAYYLAGYAVELAIKACIAKRIRGGVLPDRNFITRAYQHRIADLIIVAGLKDELGLAIADQQFESNWGIVCNWSEESRYQTWEADEAARLIEAISEPGHGVLQWLRRYY